VNEAKLVVDTSVLFGLLLARDAVRWRDSFTHSFSWFSILGRLHRSLGEAIA
jgi:hypothetical protein